MIPLSFILPVKMLGNCKYFELDFEPLIQNKVSLMLQSEDFMSLWKVILLFTNRRTLQFPKKETEYFQITTVLHSRICET
jgi:hypothetical protein